MKLYLASFAILATSPLAQGLCLKDALSNDGTLTSGDGIPCSFGKFKNLLTDKITNEGLEGCDDINTELLDLFGEVRIKFVASKIREACETAPEPDQSPTTNFRDIFQSFPVSSGGLDNTDVAHDRFLKEFYDGNTFINQYVGGGEYTIPSNDIKTFYNDSARRTVVDWPDDEGVENFDLTNSCDLNTVMCCWVTDRRIDNDGNCAGPYPNGRSPEGSGCIDADPADNNDICYADHGRSPGSSHVGAGSFTIYPDGQEGDTHCHGFVFAEDDNDESSLYKANNLFYISMYDHLRNRGYVRNVPGAPMCGCLEQMPSVDRSDCTQTSHSYLYSFNYDADTSAVTAAVSGRKVSFDACDGETANDLESKYVQMVSDGSIANQEDEFGKYIVGRNDAGESQCPGAIESFLESKGIRSIER